MVCHSKQEILESKVNPYAKCSKDNGKLVLCTKCGVWVCGRYVKMKRVTSILTKGFICERCVEARISDFEVVGIRGCGRSKNDVVKADC